MDNQSDDRQSDHGLVDRQQGSATATSPPPAPSSHAGAVLRRSPPLPGRPQAPWALATAHPSNVDIVDRKKTGPDASEASSPALSSNVDTVDNAARRLPRPIQPPKFAKPPVPVPPASNVDTLDKNSSSKTIGKMTAMPRPSPLFKSVSIPPVPVHPNSKRDVSRTGPNEDRLRAVIENRKQMLADRALAKGRSPGLGSAPSPVAPGKTRSQKTYEDYLRRGESLMRRYKRFAKLEQLPIDAIDPVDFVAFCISLKPTLKASAWRAYRQGVRTLLETLPHERTSEAIHLMDIDINENTGEVKKKKDEAVTEDGRVLPRRTSAKKLKRFRRNTLIRFSLIFRISHAPNTLQSSLTGWSPQSRPASGRLNGRRPTLK